MNMSSQDMAAVMVWSQHHLQDSAYLFLLEFKFKLGIVPWEQTIPRTYVGREFPSLVSQSCERKLRSTN